MVTQLLFGETYTIIEDKEDWLSIITNFDQYPCWISAKQHTRLTQAEFKNLTNQTLSSELVQVINNTASKSVFPITIGASLRLVRGLWEEARAGCIRAEQIGASVRVSDQATGRPKRDSASSARKASTGLSGHIRNSGTGQPARTAVSAAST